MRCVGLSVLLIIGSTLACGATPDVVDEDGGETSHADTGSTTATDGSSSSGDGDGDGDSDGDPTCVNGLRIHREADESFDVPAIWSDGDTTMVAGRSRFSIIRDGATETHWVGESSIHDLWAISADEAYLATSLGILGWDGEEVGYRFIPPPGASTTGIWGFDSDDLWAIGSGHPEGEEDAPSALFFHSADGWHLADSIGGGAEYEYLHAIDGRSGDRAVAAGSRLLAYDGDAWMSQDDGLDEPAQTTTGLWSSAASDSWWATQDWDVNSLRHHYWGAWSDLTDDIGGPSVAVYGIGGTAPDDVYVAAVADDHLDLFWWDGTALSPWGQLPTQRTGSRRRVFSPAANAMLVAGIGDDGAELWRLDGDVSERIWTSGGVGQIIDLDLGPDAVAWASGPWGLVVRDGGEPIRWHRVTRLPVGSSVVAARGPNDIWVGTTEGVFRWDGQTLGPEVLATGEPVSALDVRDEPILVGTSGFPSHIHRFAAGSWSASEVGNWAVEWFARVGDETYAGGPSRTPRRWTGSTWDVTEWPILRDVVVGGDGDLYGIMNAEVATDWRIARWDGEQWAPVGLPPRPWVAVAAHGGDVWAIAESDYEQTVQGAIALFDGTAWRERPFLFGQPNPSSLAAGPEGAIVIDGRSPTLVEPCE